MKFRAFNLSATVKKYNDGNGTSLDLSHSFGLVSLDQETLKTVQAVCEAFDACAQNTCGAVPSVERKKIKSNIYSYIKKDEFKKVREDLKAVHDDDKKMRAHQWYVDNKERLSSEKLWDDFERSADEKKVVGNILFLKRWWRRHGEYSHYTSYGLWYASSSLLDTLEQYESLASLELLKMKRKLAPNVFYRYQEYLIKLNLKIKKTREKICWAMLARLEVADQQGTLNFDDVMMYLVWQLEESNLLKRNNGYLKTQRHGLSPELFNKFHTYIIEHGSEEQKEAMLKLSWFQSLQSCTLFRTDKNLLVVPKIMVKEELVPKKAWFRSIFKHRYFRYKFFKDKLSLMASLDKVMLDGVKDDVAGFYSFRERLNQNEDLKRSLELMDKHCILWEPKGLFIYLCSTTFRFVNLWNEYSVECHEQLHLRSIQILIGYCDQFQKRYGRANNLSEILPVDQAYYLIDKANQYLKKCTDENLEKKLRMCLSDVEYLKNKALNEKKNISSKIKNTPRFSNSEFGKAEGALDTVKCIDLFSQTESQFNGLVKAMLHAASELKCLGASDDSEALNECMVSIFIQYLGYSAMLVDVEARLENDRTSTVEELLLKVAQPDIVERVCVLQKSREEGVDLSTYQIKCESYSFSYLDNISRDKKRVLSTEMMEESEKNDFDRPLFVERVI